MIERINPDIYVARNLAIKENILLLFACIINKIPLFLTGNPGSSKTLSLNLLVDTLKNNPTGDALLATYPKLYTRFY